MPVIPSTTATFRSASTLPDTVIRALLEDQRSANIILPHILKSRTLERDGTTLDNIWIVSSTVQSNGESSTLR